MTYRSGGPPHAYPKGLHGCYRCRLVRDPKLIERSEKTPMVAARIAVHLASPNSSREDRDALTEFVNVIAFDERCRDLLLNCSTGRLIGVVGGVTLEFYTSRRTGERKISRTMIAEDLYAAAASIQPKGTHPADIDGGLKERLGEAASAAQPEPADHPYGEAPPLD